MAVCDNCGRDSNLIMAIEMKGVKLGEYCPEFECVEMAKNQMRSVKFEMRSTHYETIVKGGKQ